MHFCSLQEAWGNDNYITQNYSNFNDKKNTSSLNNSIRNNSKKNFKKIEKFSNFDKKKFVFNNHDDIINHVLNCDYCKQKLRMKLFNPLVSIIKKAIDEYREPIVLILITVFIVLLINLVLKLD